MFLSQLLQDALSISLPPEASDVEILAVTHDSRQVRGGSLFVARGGKSADGHRYIPQAIQAGAIAVVGEAPASQLNLPESVYYLQVPNAMQALAWLSAAFFGFPARQLVMIGVTGTDGKTTTSNFIYSILQTAGYKAGLISTVNAVIGTETYDTGLHVTTPDAPEVQAFLAKMVQAGMTHCVLEVTSHGLAQHRATACDFDIAVVTNITHEHLDFHGSYESYLSAKAMLFEGLETAHKKPSLMKLAILNRDDRSYEPLQARTHAGRVTYGQNPNSDLHIQNIRTTPSGTRFAVQVGGQTSEFTTRMLGEFNAWNASAAISACYFGLHLPMPTIQQGIANLSGVAGRMELYDMGQDFVAVVDFAHTPYSLQAVVQAARKLTHGRVWAIFGSAGLRDRAKRRWMAEIGAEYADISVLTAEDPRTESLDGILAEMADGCLAKGGAEGRTFFRIPDRYQAIRFAVQNAQAGDIVLACGKAHEQSMCFGTTEYPWDDRLAMRAALAERLNLPPVAVPQLPTAFP
ncbi:MAG TPA: UDP-N-acetylmuramoyl-L-alanyl-D-glutamate--2,6-diaminopimelate ligase [Anaerolineales bacterium]|nr:UDP-N-acetylmuramoyl-L-alanyl-D-glutamate--2,6-diaminopimelate ligase [Anaerolineales bacterium]